MDIWSILGIEPTEDIKLIKKAYAKQLKIYHPEDDAEGFQKLREAYDAALKYSKQFTNNSKLNTSAYNIIDQDKSENDISQNSSKAFNEFEDKNTSKDENSINQYTPLQINLETIEQIDTDNQEDFVPNKFVNIFEEFIETRNIDEEQNEFIKHAEALYVDFFQRIDIINWNKLLDCDVMWDIKNRESLNYKFLRFLENHHYFPQDIWKLLQINFTYTEHEEYKYKSSDYNLNKYIAEQINKYKNLNYYTLERIEGVDYEKYLDYRAGAFSALADGNLNLTNTYIMQAKEIYKEDDPDLLRIEGLYYLRTYDMDKALSAFTHLLSLIPNDTEALFNRGKIYYEKYHFTQAIEDYLKLETYMEDNYEVHLILGQCYFKQDKLEEAKKHILKVLELKPYNKEANTYIDEINQQLENILYLKLKKDRKNSDLKQQLTELRQEITERNKLQPKKKICYKNLSAYPIALFIALCIVIFFLIHPIAETKVPHTETSNSSSTQVKTASENKSGLLSLNSENIEQLSKGEKVEVTLTNIKLITMSMPNQKDANDGATTILNSASKYYNSSISTNRWLYIYVGTLSDKQIVLFSQNPLDANIKALNFVGIINDMPSKNIINAIISEKEKLFTSNIGIDNFVTDKYIFMDSKIYKTDNTKIDISSVASYGHIILTILAISIVISIKLIKSK